MNFESVMLLLVAAVLVYTGARLLMLRRAGAIEPDNWRIDVEDKAQQGSLQRQLLLLRLNMEPWAFLLTLILASVLIFFLFIELFPQKLYYAVLAAMGILVFTLLVMRDLSRRRVRRFENHLTHAIDLMRASLQGGQNPLQALSIAAQASKGDIRREFNRLVQALDLGLSMEDATHSMRRKYRCDGVRLFSQVLAIKANCGGDLAELLFSVNRIIRDKVKLRLRMSGQLAGVRYSAVFVALMPYLIIPFFLWKYPEWLETLRGHEWGPVFLVTAILLQVLGFFWIRSILRTET